MVDDVNPRTEVLAARSSRAIRLDAAHSANEWQSAQPIRFSADWQAQNGDPRLETEVRVLWSPEMLYLRFVCLYRELFVFGDSDPNGRRDHLWERDVAEAFVQPPESLGMTGGNARHPRFKFHQIEGDYDTPYAHYKEFEIAPNGMWIDLDIVPSGRGDLKSGLARSVYLDEKNKVWTAEMEIPMKTLTTNFNPSATWRVNFYRIEGKVEPRKYLAWQPTMTPQPNFHVPEKFGVMRFS
jgi:cellulose/xylan binding protein with CBM9 domain